MIVNYCSKCGNKNEQFANFCPKCGQNLKTLAQNPVQHHGEENEDTEEVAEFNIEALKGKINISVQMDVPQPVTVGDIINEARQTGPSSQDLGKRNAPNLPKGKDLLKTIAKECSSSRDKSSEVE